MVRVGHRGAPKDAPANTLRGYRRAAELGCHMVEVDVHATLDGALMLAHDDTLATPAGRVHIATTPIAILRTLDVGGEPPPLLSEALSTLAGRSGILIDLKVVGCEEELVATVRRSGVREVMFCGENIDSLLRIRSLAPEIALSLTLSPRHPFDGNSVPVVPTEWSTIAHRALTARSLQEFHAQGVRVLAWTVDVAPRTAQLISWGVDGLTSNDPAMVGQVAAACEAAATLSKVGKETATP